MLVRPNALQASSPSCRAEQRLHCSTLNRQLCLSCPRTSDVGAGAVFDYQFTNSDGFTLNKIIFISWYASSCCRLHSTKPALHTGQVGCSSKAFTILQASSGMYGCDRAPEVARVKKKMMYASTKDFFKGFLDGLSVEVQASGMDDLRDQDIEDSVRANTTRA